MVELKDTAPSSIKTRYYTACSGSLVQEQSRCDHVKIGTVFEYTISVEVSKNPTNDQSNSSRTYYLVCKTYKIKM